MGRLLVMADPRHPSAGPPDRHLFEAGGASHLFVVNGSRVYTVAPGIAAALGEAGDPALLDALGLSAADYVERAPPVSVPMRSLSLAIAQSCNLACAYCYAEGGSFGGAERQMPADVARAAVDTLFRDAGAGERVNLAFLGGEPLANRALLRQCTEHAAALGETRGVQVGFSITTNGTLLTPDDGAFFERFGFAVTVSLDGTREQHDRLRPFKDGRGSFERILARTAPLVAMQRRMQVSARVTVTPANLTLQATLDDLLGRGFHSVGFSPLLASSSGSGEMDARGLEALLAEMIACGETFEERVARGERYAFQNLVSALEEIHRGTHRPYPCGAGGGYFGVSADGHLYACHRFVEDPAARLGSVGAGVDRERQRRWLADRHVHVQEPCGSCWARYLCGGGCHHEVLRRGRTACDYVRGWLHYCLQAYVRLLEARPDYFGVPG
jgi:uncharacterized protein